MDQDIDDKERAALLKLKREKKKMAREERRRKYRQLKDAKRKAQLRRAFARAVGAARGELLYRAQ